MNQASMQVGRLGNALWGLAAAGLMAITSPAGAQDAPVMEDPETGLVEEQSEPAAEPAAESAPAPLALEANGEVALEADLGDAEPTSGGDSGLWLFGGRIGGIASFNGLGPFVHGGLELGYVFPVLDQGLGAVVRVEYSAPKTKGSVEEDFDPERVPQGSYDWELLQKELVIEPGLLYRITSLSDWLTPYTGLGLRVYLLETIVKGKADDQSFDETHERSTRIGLGLPLGAEMALGPGGVTVELQFQWGGLPHTLTGDSHLAALSLFVGYRLLL